MKMELTEGSETSAYINQTPGNYPKGNLLYQMIIYLIVRIIFGEQYKWRNSYLCNFLQSAVTSSLLSPNIFLSTLLSKTRSICPEIRGNNFLLQRGQKPTETSTGLSLDGCVTPDRSQQSLSPSFCNLLRGHRTTIDFQLRCFLHTPIYWYSRTVP